MTSKFLDRAVNFGCASGHTKGAKELGDPEWCSEHLGGRPEARNRRDKEGRSALPAVAAIASVAAIATTSAATPTAITATATTATTVAAAATTATGTFGLWTGFVDHEVAAAKVLAVKAVDGAFRIFVIGNFDEGEAARLTREAIANQTDC
jgi:hypothetical protein